MSQECSNSYCTRYTNSPTGRCWQHVHSVPRQRHLSSSPIPVPSASSSVQDDTDLLEGVADDLKDRLSKAGMDVEVKNPPFFGPRLLVRSGTLVKAALNRDPDTRTWTVTSYGDNRSQKAVPGGDSDMLVSATISAVSGD